MTQSKKFNSKNENFKYNPSGNFFRIGLRSFVVSEEISFQRTLQIFFPVFYITSKPEFFQDEKEIVRKISSQYRIFEIKKNYRYKVKVLYDDQDLFRFSYGQDLKHKPKKNYNVYLVSEYILSC